MNIKLRLDRNVNKEEFYNKVNEILGESYPNESIGYGRWRRGSGEGRYPGIGVIRWYSETSIHVMFHTPFLIKTFSEADKCITYITTTLSQVEKL